MEQAMIEHTVPQAFVGVCGVQSNSDYAKLLELATQVLPGTKRFLMAGVKDSRVSIDPSSMSSNVRPFVHCDFVAKESFERIVERNLERTAHYAHGLQLNVLPWLQTDYSSLWHSIKRQYPHIKLMLQAHKSIMESYSPEQIARRLSGLPIDYVLFDASQSRGIPYLLETMAAYVDTVREHNPNIGVVVSGGLAGENVQQLFGPLATRYDGLSCDAFLRLYDQAVGALSWPRVREYLLNWRKTFDETSHA